MVGAQPTAKTLPERVAEVRKMIGDDLGMGARHQLLMLLRDLTDDEAEAVLRFLAGDKAS